jgi:hypothetical protein
LSLSLSRSPLSSFLIWCAGRSLRETILAALQPVAFAPVVAIHDAVDRAGILDSQLAGQDARVARAASVANNTNRPLHPLSDNSRDGHQRQTNKWLTRCTE